ncbi:MAG: cobalamin biosynthesis protein CbiD [Tissierellia bacterium]|nr:cobalamin biosynthesis protein CbiD [Tissierellia bacterium]
MKLEEYIVQDGKRLRCGYTTGSCAHGAVKACCIMLKSGEPIEYVEIPTPAGIDLKLKVENIEFKDNSVSCGIIKDAGDDPDATDGIEIRAIVESTNDGTIVLDGGFGVGRITRKGLFGEVGEAAINPVPKRIITEELERQSINGLKCTITVPEGEVIAKKTFNKYLGIEGGISIIGTKGIVYPMSESSLVATIHMEMDMLSNKGIDGIVLTPGNYGEEFLKDLDIEYPVVKVSNFIGDALTYTHYKGYRKIYLLGHIGKFAKLSIGVFNTHNRYADTRMEAFIYYLSLMGAPIELLKEIDRTISAEEASKKCIESGYGEVIKRMQEGINSRIKTYLKDEELEVHAYIYTMESGVIYW